jgi:hypothetical protein
MSKVISRSLQLSALLAVLLVAVPVTAKPIHPYSEPIAMGDHAFDVGAMLVAAFERTQWTLAKENDALYLGKLSYQEVDVQVRISVADNVLTLTLDSVTESGCGSNCKDLGEERALRWLVSLRRHITYELTLRVRDSLQ